MVINRFISSVFYVSLVLLAIVWCVLTVLPSEKGSNRPPVYGLLIENRLLVE